MVSAGRPDWEEDENRLDGRRTTLTRLKNDEQFVYEFDFGDSWEHLCTVGPTRIDPIDQLGILPQRPLPYRGWGVIPDQYGRLWDGDGAEEDSNPGPDPKRTDLPPLRPMWGPRPGR
jgi:hypothetical protein